MAAFGRNRNCIRPAPAWRSGRRSRTLVAPSPVAPMTPFRTARALPCLALALASTLPAQVPASEFAARRDSLAARVDEGVVVAFGGRTLVQDFGTFFQLAAFAYLTNFDEPDAAFVMVVHGKRGTSTLFVSPINA